MTAHNENELLKSCPFCGGEAISIWGDIPEEDFKFTGLSHEVQCQFCRVKIMRENEDDAIKAWNTRTERKSDGTR